MEHVPELALFGAFGTLARAPVQPGRPPRTHPTIRPRVDRALRRSDLGGARYSSKFEGLRALVDSSGGQAVPEAGIDLRDERVNIARLRALSAGPDGRLGTDDDIDTKTRTTHRS